MRSQYAIPNTQSLHGGMQLGNATHTVVPPASQEVSTEAFRASTEAQVCTVRPPARATLGVTEPSTVILC